MPAERRQAERPWPSWPEGFVGSHADGRAVFVLSALRGTTPRRLIGLANEHGSAAAVLARIREGRGGTPGDRILARSVDPDAVERATAACGARLVAWGSPDYPPALREIHDPPLALYVLGAPLPDPLGAVAVVGARRCSGTGRDAAYEIGRGLASAGVTVVSGAARGIDAAAHQGALSVRAPTLAVLGSGLDTVSPAVSRRLARLIVEAQGTLVSEYPPGTPAVARHFPARNRIVAGLSLATVVVEGADGSGSMISAEHALEFGRDVYALAGSVASPLSHVPLQLIRDGARMIRGADDLLADLGLDGAPTRVSRLQLEDVERIVLDELLEPTLADAVAARLSMAVPEVVGILMRLELRGLVRNVGGRYETTLQTRRRQEAGASTRSALGTPERGTSRTGTPAASSRLAAIEDR